MADLPNDTSSRSLKTYHTTNLRQLFTCSCHKSILYWFCWQLTSPFCV